MLPEFTYLALFLLLLPQESGVPLWPPGYAVLIVLGYRAAHGDGNAYALLGVAALASFLGANILYGIGRGAGHPLVVRHGRRFGLTGDRLARVDTWLQRCGVQAIIAGRLFPGMRITAGLAAGIFGVPYRVFVAIAALTGVLWAGFYTGVGIFAGKMLGAADVAQIRAAPVAFSLLTGAAVVIAVAVLAYRRRTLAQGG